MPNPYDTSFLDAEIAAVQREHRRRLDMLCRGEQPDSVPAFAACAPRMPLVGPYDAGTWLSEALEELRSRAASFRDPVMYRPFALSLARYDLHFPAALMGCPVHTDENGLTWWTSLSQLGQTIEEFRFPDLDTHPDFQEMLDLLRFVVEATEGRIPVEIPYVSEPLILAVGLFGNEFLALLAADPDRADVFVESLTTFILDMRRRFLDVAPDAPLIPHGSCGRPMPESYNLLYECTTHLISGPAYERHFRDRDRDVMRCGAPGAGIHLCGEHTQHCTAWQQAPELKMIQLNDRAAEDLDVYWRNLRPDQYIVFMPCEKFSLDDALRITGGRQLVVEAEVEQPIPVRG